METTAEIEAKPDTVAFAAMDIANFIPLPENGLHAARPFDK